MKGRKTDWLFNVNKLITEISSGQSSINPSEFPSGILIFVVGYQRYKVLK
ncbi:MAG: hypothetical protein IPN49_00300 [Saprospiraceae bacterium]|nr:hypothetical protein [Saprospiraceae bacterium]MBK7523009.1 hypothetical protein [Saprospiraceae bacterium]MBK8370614.1 hypothetical protein [Saprospiraceae bacterium]MBK8817589.1 hypothetical protein [Saprospiraceae bacterium]MBK9044510.1 hypothetical protein [Saprospiraceae bacterium]